MLKPKPKCSNISLDSKVEDFRCLAKLHANAVTCILIAEISFSNKHLKVKDLIHPPRMLLHNIW